MQSTIQFNTSRNGKIQLADLAAKWDSGNFISNNYLEEDKGIGPFALGMPSPSRHNIEEDERYMAISSFDKILYFPSKQ